MFLSLSCRGVLAAMTAITLVTVAVLSPAYTAVAQSPPTGGLQTVISYSFTSNTPSIQTLPVGIPGAPR